ncbi:NADH-quinone oxidoreductase subunit L [Azomonas macrocytogenes]|uniref:NADH-quinone oxidoreductase subunit L n=1 Tax=Azomonas macrocytogenes TaxID=69962 RepID=A0A839T2N2_AZOMA|nr:NADH-quinone oxidoreductase subunit L [Azomonas macrocytogenes]MBB3103672.1 NADH-quinone oxidoreductase subunit L [Azomonas macrocytogenes]
MNLLFLTFLFPLIGFSLLAFSRGRWSENTSATIGVGSIALSALSSACVILDFHANPPAGGAYVQTLWQWMSVDGFTPKFALYLDGLSVTMLGVVTGVGFFIHLFASWYMRGEAGYSRFFAYTNLFIASMLFLVLGDNLLFLYFGWEGVGLCSYLLIGFYYADRNNGNAALKAFIVTRVGDVFMAFGLFILAIQVGTLDIQQLLQLAPQKFAEGDLWITLATLALVGGAVGKSAQLPLQTWLADAMAGPTPVSALIHAATMVTAGVYLIARTHGLFLLAPDILHLVGIIGALTLLMAGCAALVQTDIKRVLAYSTMSQLGYMFLALGVGAWDAAIFHLMTHAFFKALLFLASGSVILACHHEQNILKMGGLWKKLPLAYASFVIGGSALAALPVLTAGFYSKDEILWEAYASGHGLLFFAGLVGAFLTSIYTFRLIYLTFHGEAKTEAHNGHGLAHSLPLGVLIVLSTFVGALIHPPLEGVLPESIGHAGGDAQLFVELLCAAVAICGVIFAALLFIGDRKRLDNLAHSEQGRTLSALWYEAWGFDRLYDKLFVKPFLAICKRLGLDPIDQGIGLIPRLARGGHLLMSRSETGLVRWYAASIAGGAVLLLGLVLL